MKRPLALLALALALRASAASQTESYTYDPAGRLTTVLYQSDTGQTAVCYELDALGNCLRLFALGPATPQTDTDQNGLPDLWELRYFGQLGNPADADTDGDGLSHQQEAASNTDPNRTDTDGDGADDPAELISGTDPLDPDDVFRLSLDLSQAGTLQLACPLKSGHTYQFQQCLRLGQDWVDVGTPWVVIEDHVYVFDIPITGTAFYRIAARPSAAAVQQPRSN